MIARLRAEAPDLADLVVEERMTAKEATTVLEGRIEELNRKRRTATDLLASFVNTWHPRGSDPADFAARIAENFTPKYWPRQSMPLTKRDFEAAAAVFAAIAAIAEKWESPQ